MVYVFEKSIFIRVPIFGFVHQTDYEAKQVYQRWVIKYKD